MSWLTCHLWCSLLSKLKTSHSSISQMQNCFLFSLPRLFTFSCRYSSSVRTVVILRTLRTSDLCITSVIALETPSRSSQISSARRQRVKTCQEKRSVTCNMKCVLVVFCFWGIPEGLKQLRSEEQSISVVSYLIHFMCATHEAPTHEHSDVF